MKGKTRLLAVSMAMVCCSLSGTVMANLLSQDLNPASPSLLEALDSASSPDNIWSQSNIEGVVSQPTATINVRTIDAREMVVNSSLLEEALSRAPVARPGMAPVGRAAPAYIYLPAPDGGYVQFSITRTQMISPEMEARFPGNSTYRGYAVNDRATTVALDLTTNGFHAQVLQPGKRWFIDPQFKEDTGRYVSYYKAIKKETRQCLLDAQSASALTNRTLGLSALAGRTGDNLRTYTLALAYTGEYGAFFGGITNATAATITTINRVNGIYEKELGITLNYAWVASYDNPVTDPFTGNNNASTLINESQVVLDSLVGNANYDIGHTFSTGAGGLAGLGVVCNNANKGRGVTGLANPTGDVFDVDFVAHEIGHQFSGNHTFNGANGNCSGANRNAGTAFEPGSGSTIQAYAGICGADNLQSNSDAQMHAISHFEINNYTTTGTGSTCGTVTATGNSIPDASAPQTIAIPHSTPFFLIGDGTDADTDPLTFLWEQIDLGPQAALTAPDDGAIPLFRSVPPTASNIRFFPDFDDVDNGINDPAEKLPAMARNMQFALTVRDGLGGVDADFNVVNVDSNGPFEVTSPNGGETISGNYLVTWDVAGTDAAPVSASNVSILLSLTGSGLSYSPLITTPNDGSELIDFSAYAGSTTARLAIQYIDPGYSFYDLSDDTFVIDEPVVLVCGGLPVTVDLNLGQVPTTGSDVIYGTPGGDTINGLGGNDVICGGDGYDALYGGPGADIIYGGDSLGNDTTFNDLFGGSGADELYGSAYDDFLYGQGGADYLQTNNATANQDQLYGGSANDYLISYSAGGSLMRGQGNNDSIFGSDQADVITGDPGADIIYGYGGNDDIKGGSGRDDLYGGDDDDLIAGNGQRDNLYGEDGDDTLLGGLGNDYVDGGPNGAIGDTCNGQGQEAIGAGDTEVNCEISTGFPRMPAGLAVIQPVQPGRVVLTEEQLDLIDRCDLTLEECLAGSISEVRASR